VLTSSVLTSSVLTSSVLTSSVLTSSVLTSSVPAALRSRARPTTASMSIVWRDELESAVGTDVDQSCTSQALAGLVDEQQRVLQR
jgi:hypothetical protein